MKMRGFILWLVVGLSIGQGTVAVAEEEPVGIVLAVQGTVTMQPATMTPPVPLRQFDEIGRLSILESQPGSRCKLLYADDSLLTLGDNSRLEVVEQSYEAGGDQRAFVAHLARGTVRALVARQFEGDNSTFEIDAGTSAVTARGTYFVTWVNGKPLGWKASHGRRGIGDGGSQWCCKHRTHRQCGLYLRRCHRSGAARTIFDRLAGGTAQHAELDPDAHRSCGVGHLRHSVAGHSEKGITARGARCGGHWRSGCSGGAADSCSSRR